MLVVVIPRWLCFSNYPGAICCLTPHYWRLLYFLDTSGCHVLHRFQWFSYYPGSSGCLTPQCQWMLLYYPDAEGCLTTQVLLVVIPLNWHWLQYYNTTQVPVIVIFRRCWWLLYYQGNSGCQTIPGCLCLSYYPCGCSCLTTQFWWMLYYQGAGGFCTVPICPNTNRQALLLKILQNLN